jgi:FkbM family methyltransferase
LLSEKIVTAAQFYLNAYARIDDYNIETNGEDAILKQLCAFNIRVVVDVGANVGDWTQAVLIRLPDACIHAFELSPETAPRLLERFKYEDRVKINNFGLSNQSGEVAISHVDADNTLTTLYENPARLEGRRLIARVMKGSEYIERERLETIDLLKIDTEGHDLDVIAGFDAALDRCKIIQFEYNEMSWSRGIFLDKFEEMLPGFRIGRLTAAGVLWDHSIISNSRATAGNMIAVPKDDAELIATLSRFE